MPDFDLQARRAAQAAARADIAGRVVDLDLPAPTSAGAAHLDPHAVVNCQLCDDDGYNAARRVCDHTDHAAAAARGMAKIRATLAATHPTARSKPGDAK